MSNLINGFSTISQQPLDEKTTVKSVSEISSLGTNNEKAFKYYNNMRVTCILEGEDYSWRQGLNGEVGLMSTSFTYPTGSIAWGYDYSGKTFNFYLIPKILKTESGTLVVTQVGGKQQVERTKTVSDSLIVTNPTPTTEKIEKPTLISNTLSIVREGVDGEFERIELPSTTSIPNLYVNNAYYPSYGDWLQANKNANGGTAVANFTYSGDGTIAKPYTDSYKWVLGSPLTFPTKTNDTAIENAFKGYMGTSLSRLTPDKEGNRITIQSNSIGYNYSGDFNYTGLNLLIEGQVICSKIDGLINMDNPLYFDSGTTKNVSARIVLAEGAALNVKGKPFFNSGNNIASDDYSFSKTLYLSGKGVINDLNTYTYGDCIINSGITSANVINNNNNAGYLTFEISCTLNSVSNCVYNVAGRSRVEFQGAVLKSGLLTANITTSLKAFNQLGGWVRMYDSKVSASSLSPVRTNVFTLDSDSNDATQPLLIIKNTVFNGGSVNTFSRLATKGIIDIQNCTTNYFGSTNIFKIPSATPIWYVLFRNNTFEQGIIPQTDADPSYGGIYSSINTIGTDVIEYLKQYGSRSDASTLPIGAKFLNTNDGSPDKTTWKIDIVL